MPLSVTSSESVKWCCNMCCNKSSARLQHAQHHVLTLSMSAPQHVLLLHCTMSQCCTPAIIYHVPSLKESQRSFRTCPRLVPDMNGSWTCVGGLESRLLVPQQVKSCSLHSSSLKSSSLHSSSLKSSSLLVLFFLCMYVSVCECVCV